MPRVVPDMCGIRRQGTSRMALRITIPLITTDNRKAIFWPAAFFIYLSYVFTGKYPLFEPWHPPLTAVDAWIPFVPLTIWIYLSHVGFMFAAWWWMIRGAGCTRLLWAMVLAAAVSTVYFLFFPTELPRRELVDIQADPATRALWAFLMRADHPTNSFPSMHVAEAVIGGFALWRAHVNLRVLAPVWSAAIALTTMTTEQHVFVDVLGGIGLACLCILVVETCLDVRAPVNPEGTHPVHR